MLSRLPRPVLIGLVSLLVAIVLAGITWGLVTLINSSNNTLHILGWVLAVLIVGVLVFLGATSGPQLYRLYKFQKYFKEHENSLNMLPGLMQSGRMQEALVRFESVMKQAPDNAYVYYMRAFFLRTAGKLPEAMSAANKALTLVDRDPFLPMILQQMGGQMGQPTTVAAFREQLDELRQTLEPRVHQMRERREKAAEKRKKKSR